MKDASAAAPPRTLARRALVVVAAVALLCGGLWLGRRALVAGAARLALERAGFADVELAVVDVGLEGIELRDVRAADSALEIASLRARWSPLQRRIDALEGRGIRLRADLRGAQPGGASGGPEQLAALLLALPRRVRIEDARAALDTDFGAVALALDANVDEQDAELRGQATLELAQGSSQAKLALTLQGVPERLDGVLELDGTLDGLQELPLALIAKGRAQLTWRDRVLELYTPECVELRAERAAFGSVRLAAPLAACAGEVTEPVLRAEFAGGAEPRVRVQLPLRAAQAKLLFGASDRALAVSLREPRVRATLETPAARGVSLEVSAESAESAGLELRADTWSIAARIGQGALDATLRARALRDLRRPASFAPLALQGTATRARAEDPLALRFELAAAGGRMRIDGRGTVDAEGGGARGELSLRPLDIGPRAARLAELSPALGRLLGDATGRVEARADARLGPEGPRIEVDLALRDAAFETRAARFSGVNGRVLLRGPAPWSTPPDQLVSAALTELGIPLTDGLLRFQLRPGAVLNVSSATFRMLGGEVRIAGPFDFGAEQRRLALEVRGLDLAEVARAAKLDGLSGTGTLDGKVPLRFVGPQVFFDAAVLQSVGEGGTIQYRPGPERTAKSRPEIVLAMRALEDFRYQELRITLDGDVSKSVLAGLYIRGSNPQLERGRPVEFNVKVDAPISALLRTSLATYRLPEAVERSLRDFRGGELR